MKEMLAPEEEVIKETIIAARHIQEFLWGDINNNVDFEEFRAMLRKRISKLDEIDVSKKYWKIEARKRLLQVAAISVNAINKLENPEFQGSNLDSFRKEIHVKEYDKDYHTVTNTWVLSQQEYDKRRAEGEFKDGAGYEYFIS